MSDPSSSPAAASTPSKPRQRNPVERFLVWGLILGLLVVVGFEGVARIGYDRSRENILAAMEASEAQMGEVHPLLIDQVSPLLVGFPVESQEDDGWEGTRHYVWHGLFRNHGLHLTYRLKNGIVFGMVSDDAPPEPVIAPSPSLSTEETVEQANPRAGGRGAEGGGDGGQRPRFDPMQSDADGDGKLSREEAPERLREVFVEIDTNGDGFLDAEELAARRARRGGGAGGGGRGGNAEGGDAGAPEGASPQRPAAEDAAPAPAAPAQP